MRRIIALVGLFVLIAACAKPASLDRSEAVIGVVTTIGTEKHSQLHLFDDSLQLVERQVLPYASLGDYFYVPEVVEHTLYMVPQGYASLKEEEIVLAIDLSSGEQRSFFIGQPGINDVCVQAGQLFTCNTLDNRSYITRLELESEQRQVIELPEIYVTKLLADDSRLYAFGTSLGLELSATLYVFDFDLNLLEQLDISDLGVTQYKAITAGEYVYFSNPVDQWDQPHRLVVAWNKRTQEFTRYGLSHDWPNDLLLIEGQLWVAHFNPVTGEHAGISFIDLASGEVSHQPLEHAIEQMVWHDSMLYTIDETGLYRYQVLDKQLRLVNRVGIELEKPGEYISGLFSIP